MFKYIGYIYKPLLNFILLEVLLLMNQDLQYSLKMSYACHF